MSERWKYQTKQGVVFAFIVMLAGSLWDLRNHSVSDVFISIAFLLKLVISLLGGIYVIGYLDWKRKNKESDKSKNQ